MKSLKLIVVGLAIVFLSACNSNEKPITTNCLTEKATGKLLIGNEGNFNWGVGTLSLYETASHVIISDVFTCQNGEPAGNVVHSLYQVNNEIFVVVNNSRKVEILDTETLKRKRTITNLNSPRYVIESANKLFISDLYNNKIAVLGSNATQPERFISVFGWVEKLFALPENKLLAIRTFRMGVTDYAPSAVMFLNDQDEKVSDSLLITNAITDAHLEGNFLLLSTTNYNSTDKDSLLVVNINSKEIIARASLSGTKGRVSKIAYSPKDKAIYYVKYNVNKIAWDAVNPQVIGQNQTVLAKTQGQEFYALAFPSLTSNQLYISDAKNYTTNGEVLIYSTIQQKVVNQIPVGIIPGSFHWIK